MFSRPMLEPLWNGTITEKRLKGRKTKMSETNGIGYKVKYEMKHGAYSETKLALARIALVTGLAVVAGVAIDSERQPSQPIEQPSAPIEKIGDHNGSAEMPSKTHLKQFSHQHGIILNQK